MRIEYVVISIVIVLVVLVALIMFSGNTIPILKEGLKSIANLVGIKVG